MTLCTNWLVANPRITFSLLLAVCLIAGQLDRIIP